MKDVLLNLYRLITLAVSLGNIDVDDERWYRRAWGGRWERWWIDPPVCSYIWIRPEDYQPSPWTGGGPAPEGLCQLIEVEEHRP